MSDSIIYNKLVRDRTPGIIRKEGKTPALSKLTKPDARLHALKLKLVEECHELFRTADADQFVKEAADVFEVLQSLAREHEIPWQMVADAAVSRREQRGGFEKFVFLHSVSDGDRATLSGNTQDAIVPSLLTPHSKEKLVDVICRELRNSSSCRIATAFCSRSMVNLLIRAFQSFAESGGKLELLTSVMNNFNNPDDLLHIQEHVPGLKLRVFLPGTGDVSDRLAGRPPPFHLKCFLFEKRDEHHALIVGSSNLTGAGLAGNHEWNLYTNSEVNLCFARAETRTVFEEAKSAFDTYWKTESVPLDRAFIESYRPHWQRAQTLRPTPGRQPQAEESRLPTPRPPQKEALEELHRRRWLGVEKTAVIAATGLGKTHLAAFDFKRSPCDNVLFVAHRESILRKAQKTFAQVLGRDGFGTVLTGNSSSGDRAQAFRVRSSVFATIQTLSRPDVLDRLSPFHFNYVVFDEFHHSEAASYRRVMDQLQPKFFLGLTATPERMDGRDVLRFCDFNVAYEARLLDAIENGWLAPFQYYAVFDETDYSQLRWTGIGYDEQQLEEHLSRDTRAELIVCNLRRYLPAEGKLKALAFCSSKGHARYMDQQFSRHGITSVCLLGEDSIDDREEAIGALQDENDPLQVICSVDILSEGADIPAVSHVLMLRPTHSLTVFLQQLGRGLRTSPGKDFLVVLDFIGNFHNSYVAPLVLGRCADLPKHKRQRLPTGFRLPNQCTVVADSEVERVWDEDIERVVNPATCRERLEDAYQELRASLGSPPSLMDFFANPEECDPQEFAREFPNWLRIKEHMQDLTQAEEDLLDTSGESFLEHVERDLKANKSYKMVVLLVLLRTSAARTEWTVSEIAGGFKQHYLDHLEQMWDYADLARSRNPVEFPLTKVETKLKQMPLKFLSNHESKFFVLDRETGTFSLKTEIHPHWHDSGFRRMVLDRTLYALKRHFYRKKVDLDAYKFDPRDVLPDHRPPLIELPFFPNLKLACGAFREGTIDQAGTVAVENVHGNLAAETHFVVQTEGDSMDGGRTPIKDRDHVLLEHRTPERAGSLRGERAVAVEYRDDSGNLAYALKQVRRGEDGQYWLASWAPWLKDRDVRANPETMFPFARFIRVVSPIQGGP